MSIVLYLNVFYTKNYAKYIYSTKKIRKLCLWGNDKRSTPILDFLISESYEVSNLLQKGALFEFLAPIVAEKISFKVDWSSWHFSQIAILFGLNKECHC